MFEIFVLFVLFQIKHFLADYLLQTRYMLGKFHHTGWVGPLTAHCLVHAWFTYLIGIFVVGLWALPLALFDFVIHFTMDRIKASPNMLGRYTTQEPQFWWALGLDQMVHHLTHYLIVYFLVM